MPLENIVWIGGIIGLSVAVQTLAGFGFALVAMALLPLIIGLQLASSLVLIMALLSSVLLVITYRKSFEWRAIAPLGISALAMIPVGIWLIDYLPEQTALRILGGFIVLYALYDALKARFSRSSIDKRPTLWLAYPFGGLCGLMTGAYTIPGPPLAIYAASQGWGPKKLKANVPFVLATVQISTLAGHFFRGNLTAEVWQLALYSLPFFCVGLFISAKLSTRVDEKRFKQIVLIVLSCIGFKLLFG